MVLNVLSPQHRKNFCSHKIGVKTGRRLSRSPYLVFRIIMPFRKLILSFTLTDYQNYQKVN